MQKLISTANIEGYELRYFMTETQSKSTPEKVLYGVHVDMFEDGTLTESDYSGPFTEDKAHMESIIARLSEGTVMPITLLEVLDDIVDELSMAV